MDPSTCQRTLPPKLLEKGSPLPSHLLEYHQLLPSLWKIKRAFDSSWTKKSIVRNYDESSVLELFLSLSLLRLSIHRELRVFEEPYRVFRWPLCRWNRETADRERERERERMKNKGILATYFSRRLDLERFEQDSKVFRDDWSIGITMRVAVWGFCALLLCLRLG